MNETPASVVSPPRSTGRHRVWKFARLNLAGAAGPWLEEHARFLGPVVLLTVLAGLPLFQFKEMSGHDSLAYLPRFVEFWENLKHGVIVPRWAPDLGAGYGEPTFNFNPPLLYYLGALFHWAGFTFIASENLAIFAFLVLAGLGMYALAADVFGRHGGLVAATAYVFAPFLQSRRYVSHALADFAAFPFIPLALWGVSRAVSKRSTMHLLIGAAAVCGLMLSSISVAVIVFPALGLCLVWLAWSERSLDGLLRGAGCLALGLALSAFFWIPALRETAFVHIARREERLDYHDHFLYVQQLIYGHWGYGLSVRGSGDGMSFALGPVHLILTAAAAVLLRPIWRTDRRAGVLVASFLALTVGSVFMMTGASLFVWDAIGALHPLQFPWRFLSFVAASTAFACGAPFLLLRGEREPAARWLMVALIAAIFLLNFRHAVPQSFLTITDADYAPGTIASKGLAATASEFEPIDVRQFPSKQASEPLSVLTGVANYSQTKKTAVGHTFVVAVGEPAQIRMNTFYFPGWKLYVDDTQRPIDHGNQNGLMDFSLTQGTHVVRFAFLNTPTRTWSTRVSMAALLLLFLIPAAEFGIPRLLRRLGLHAPDIAARGRALRVAK